MSDMGSDRDSDCTPGEKSFQDYLACLDPFQVSTPWKVGSLPHVPRLDLQDKPVDKSRNVNVDMEVHPPPMNR